MMRTSRKVAKNRHFVFFTLSPFYFLYHFHTVRDVWSTFRNVYNCRDRDGQGGGAIIFNEDILRNRPFSRHLA